MRNVHTEQEEVDVVSPEVPSTRSEDRLRVVVISKGFGKPASMYAILSENFVVSVPPRLPEPSSGLESGLEILGRAIQRFRPNVVISASRGGKYLLELWKRKLWIGPSVLLCSFGGSTPLPENIPIVMQYGKRDPSYPVRTVRRRARTTGSREMVRLYVTDDGHCPRSIVENGKLVKFVKEVVSLQVGGGSD